MPWCRLDRYGKSEMRYSLFLALLFVAGCETAPAIPEALPTIDDGQSESGITTPLVHVLERFEVADFREHFKMHGPNAQVSIAASPSASGPNKVLRVEIPAGSHTGANFSWRFRDHSPEEPERLYSRYFVRFEPGWESGRGGKLPGPSGTYGRAGWGGRPADGTNGWSARMGFKKGWRTESTQLTYYAYHLDSGSRYGQHILWDRSSSLLGLDSVGELQHGRWYCVESFIHLNDPQRSNGRLTGWVDGKLATDKKGLRFRTTRDLRIEEFWFNVYFGGTDVSEKTIVVYFDDLLLADTRLGCSERS
jgi:hypothetical protein